MAPHGIRYPEATLILLETARFWIDPSVQLKVGSLENPNTISLPEKAMEINQEIMHERACNITSNIEKINEYMYIIRDTILDLRIELNQSATTCNEMPNVDKVAILRGNIGFVEDLANIIGCQAHTLRDELHFQAYGITSEDKLKQILSDIRK